jgi:PAS domain S-box-containing protein
MTRPEEPWICLWETDEKQFVVGIVGSGPGFRSILEIIADPSYQEYMPSLRLAAVCEADFNLPKVESLKARGVDVSASCDEMLARHPEINLVVELTGKAKRMKELRDKLPGHVSIVDHNAAIFLCGLHNILQVTSHCRISLDRQTALLQTLIDEVRDDILVLDMAGRIEDVNRNVTDRLGKTKAELVGRPCWEVYDLCTSELSGGVGGALPACPYFTTRRTRERSEAIASLVDAEGRLRYYRIYSYPIFNKAGVLSHILVMRRDITTRTWLEKHRQHQEKLTVIGELSTYLAHEIRNPLCAISGFSKSLLRSENLPPAEREKLQIVVEETRRLDKMLTSILNFARPTRTAQGSADLNKVVTETVEIMRIGYAQQKVQLFLDLGENLPRTVGEPELIKQCLVNVIKNSIEAMPPEGGEVHVRTSLCREHVCLAVEDTGQGMTEKELENAFSPFFSTKEQGYGLGLAMIKKIMEEIGGGIQLASRRGEGTTVTMNLPPVLAVDADLAAAAISEAAKAARPDAAGKAREA